MTHLLVTNDFPPKVGGIQTYLWELWRRLPPEEFTVLTTTYPGADVWDRAQRFSVVRERRVLLPSTRTARRVDGLARELGAGLVVLDPALPVGRVGGALTLPYAVVVHGAEVTVPARIPGASHFLRSVIAGARGVVAAGGYPTAEIARISPGSDVVNIPPGVDPLRFSPRDEASRAAARVRLGLPGDGPLIVSASRLVPRKGMDTLIAALPYLVPHSPNVTLAVAGDGRDAGRLRGLAGKLGVAKRVRFLGRIPDGDLADLYASADVFAMLCRNRWGGLEQEGFGIVFLEAAACGVPQVAGDSGGAAEAVVDGATGLVVRDPRRAATVADALRRLLDDAELRRRMGASARSRVEDRFTWDGLAADLHATLGRWGG